MPCFIIAEAGVNHNGDMQLAKELIYAAKEAGADAIKFQTFNADTLVNKTAAKADYQRLNDTQSDTQYTMLKALELSFDDHYTLYELANSLGIEFMSTGFDNDSIDFLVDLGVKRLKIPSGEMTNIPYLQHAAKKGLPLIMSTGMCDLNEVQQALDAVLPFYSEDSKEKITLLHCTSNYPAAFSDIHLRAMQTLAQAFSLPVGYSDHSLGILVPTLAVGLGASVIEKHCTMDKSLPGPDHAASMTPDELSSLVDAIRNTELILGSSEKKPAEQEIPIRTLVRRSVSIKHDLEEGVVLSENDLILLRPGHGISPINLEQVLGATLKTSLPAGSTLLWEHLER